MEHNSYAMYSLAAETRDGIELLNMNISSGNGMDDATFLALVQTIRDFPWPSAIRPILMQATKADLSADMYTCDRTTTPPVFE